ncbi:MAG: hypothetical protein QM669_01280 [Siphonobacter sp.]
MMTILGLLACRDNTSDPLSTSFGSAVDRGTFDNSEIDEASGLIISRINKQYAWTHNDSGDQSRIFLIDVTNAQYKATVTIANATNVDWEDIAASYYNGVATLYVGDIGGNNGELTSHAIYRFAEPNPVELSGTSTVNDVDKITFQYPDGTWDAEALLVDQQTQDIYIISKLDSGAKLYKLAYPQSTTELITAEYVADLSQSLITAGDISIDNQEIIIKNYLTVYYWQRGTNETIASTLQRSPKILPYYPEPQGEAVAFATDSSGYYTTGETRNGVTAHLYFYPRQ